MARKNQGKEMLANFLVVGGSVLLVETFIDWYEQVFGHDPTNRFFIGAVMVFFSFLLLRMK